MRERPEQTEVIIQEISEEVLRSALAGSGTLLRYLATEEGADSVVAELLSNPEGSLATALLPGLKKFCDKEAVEVIKSFVREEAMPIRRAKWMQS